MKQGFLLFVALLGGCATFSNAPLRVTGQLQGSAETIKGTMSGTNLSVTSSTRATCNGTDVFVEFRQGRGTFKCSDGRMGPFQFLASGRRGTGQGTLDGRMFVFDFGDSYAAH